MNKEIHNLLKIENDNTTIFTNKELKMIDDYIKQLEAYKYNMDRDYLRLEKENKKLKEVIDKAIEYLRSNYIEVLKYDDIPSETTTYEIVTVDLLQILKGGENE